MASSSRRRQMPSRAHTGPAAYNEHDRQKHYGGQHQQSDYYNTASVQQPHLHQRLSDPQYYNSQPPPYLQIPSQDHSQAAPHQRQSSSITGNYNLAEDKIQLPKRKSRRTQSMQAQSRAVSVPPKSRMTRKGAPYKSHCAQSPSRRSNPRIPPPPDTDYPHDPSHPNDRRQRSNSESQLDRGFVPNEMLEQALNGSKNAGYQATSPRRKKTVVRVVVSSKSKNRHDKPSSRRTMSAVDPGWENRVDHGGKDSRRTSEGQLNAPQSPTRKFKVHPISNHKRSKVVVVLKPKQNIPQPKSRRTQSAMNHQDFKPPHRSDQISELNRIPPPISAPVKSIPRQRRATSSEQVSPGKREKIVVRGRVQGRGSSSRSNSIETSSSGQSTHRKHKSTPAHLEKLEVDIQVLVAQKQFAVQDQEGLRMRDFKAYETKLREFDVQIDQAQIELEAAKRGMGSSEISNLENKIADLKEQKTNALNNEDYNLGFQINQQIIEIKDKISNIKKSNQPTSPHRHPTQKKQPRYHNQQYPASRGMI